MTGFRDYDPATLDVPRRHQLLLGAVAPRPIAFVGTRDRDGRDNLSPFSFFNCFSTNPPVIVVSPALSGRDAASKDTLVNVLATGELTVSVVTRALAEQASLASAPYARGVDEWVKAGLTKAPSTRIAPPGVAESPAILECRLRQHMSLGEGKAAGQLLIADVVGLRVKDEVLDAAGNIDPYKIDQVARMGGEWYARARDGLFELPKPPARGVGVDGLPRAVRESPVLTGQDLARLGGVEVVPASDAAAAKAAGLEGLSGRALHEACQRLLRGGRVADAWQAALKIGEMEAR